ncbi:MAG: DNA-processing protein DprA [Acidobacteria bacterium]|nr:DNA-processing protein DprA [Acidobacteriota bacterium]
MTRQICDLTYGVLAEIITGEDPQSLCRRLCKERLSDLTKDAVQHLANTVTANPDKGKRIAEDLEATGIHFVSLADASYPALLREIPDPPVGLFYCGPLSNLHRPAIAIVGARSCTIYGRQTARTLAAELGRAQFVVVSGLALGIDAAAHEACLQTGSRTVAVLGSGIDTVYPKQHVPLARSIVKQNGTVVTEFPPGTPPKSHHFPIRNRIISGLSRATIVVEAKSRSGSLSTAHHCLDQGRELFAVPGPIHHATSMGTHELIRSGEAQLLHAVADVFGELQPFINQAMQHELNLAIEISDPLARKIYDRLDAFEPVSFDELVSELDTNPGIATSALIQLEQQLLVEQLPGQRWLRNPITPTSGAHAHG